MSSATSPRSISSGGDRLPQEHRHADSTYKYVGPGINRKVEHGFPTFCCGLGATMQGVRHGHRRADFAGCRDLPILGLYQLQPYQRARLTTVTPYSGILSGAKAIGGPRNACRYRAGQDATCVPGPRRVPEFLRRRRGDSPFVSQSKSVSKIFLIENIMLNHSKNNSDC